MKKLDSEEEVRGLLKTRKPMVIFFYMDGCPHCDATMDPWKKVASQGFPYEFVEVESANVPPETGITGFPHFMVRHPDGSTTESDGEERDEKELEKKLKLRKKGGLRSRRRTARRRAGRTVRRVRKGGK